MQMRTQAYTHMHAYGSGQTITRTIMYICMRACLHGCMRTHASARTSAHKRTCTTAHAHTHAERHTQTHTCMRTHKHIHTNTLFYFRALRTHAAAGQTHERLQTRQTTLGGQPTSDLAVRCATRLAKLQRGMYVGTSPASCSRMMLCTGMMAGAAGATTLASANR